MANPNPNEFAKSVLWRLASIQADVYQNQLLLVEILARQLNQKATGIQEKWKTQAETLRQHYYSESLRAAGLDDDSGPIPGRSQPRL